MRTVLYSFSGGDRSGITSRIFNALAQFDVNVLDVGQVVLRGRLTVGVLISAPLEELEKSLRHRLSELAGELGLELFIQPGEGDSTNAEVGVHLTLMGMPLRPQAVASITQVISDLSGNIERISRVSDYPVVAIEFFVSGVDLSTIKTLLAPIAKENGVDIAVQPGGQARHSKRLVMLDVDSTLIQNEVIELLADRAGSGELVKAITARAMNGEIDFANALRERVATLAGLTQKDIEEVQSIILLTPGARTLVDTLHHLGIHVGVVSGGFIEFVAPLAQSLGIKFVRANSLEIIEGVLTGRVIGPIIDRAAKAEALREYAASMSIPLAQTVAIGDGANDLDMIAAAGLGIAFNAKPLVAHAADAAISAPYLDSVLFLLGITRREITSYQGG
ncbi:MAG: phosphoserine phosphatase SerB [Actinomycetes bacterium]